MCMKEVKGDDGKFLPPLPVIPREDAFEFVVRTHVDDMIGHLQPARLWDRIRKSVYVPNCESLSKLVVLNCGKCMQAKDCFKSTAEAPLQKGNIPTSIFDHWHLDLWSCNAVEKDEPEVETKEEKKHRVYVIGAIDVFSKYMIGRVATDKTAATVGRFLIDEIIMRFG